MTRENPAIWIGTEVRVVTGEHKGAVGNIRSMGGGKSSGPEDNTTRLGIRVGRDMITVREKDVVLADAPSAPELELKECQGCGAKVIHCKDCAHQNWYISCGCDSHGDHAGCDKRCEVYGCAHPRGLVIAGTLEEAEKYSDEVPARYLVERALLEARKELEKKHEKKLLKLRKLELSLDDYPEK